MQAIFLLVRSEPKPAGVTDVELLMVRSVTDVEPYPRFDTLTEATLESHHRVELSSAQHHCTDSDEVQVWSYPFGVELPSFRSWLFVLIGDDEALGRLLYSKLSFDRFIPEQWRDDAA